MNRVKCGKCNKTAMLNEKTCRHCGYPLFPDYIQEEVEEK